MDPHQQLLDDLETARLRRVAERATLQAAHEAVWRRLRQLGNAFIYPAPPAPEIEDDEMTFYSGPIAHLVYGKVPPSSGDLVETVCGEPHTAQNDPKSLPICAACVEVMRQRATEYADSAHYQITVWQSYLKDILFNGTPEELASYQKHWVRAVASCEDLRTEVFGERHLEL